MNLAAVSTFIFDLDGVLWRGDTPVEGAVAAVNELLAAGKRCLYCTNNSSRTQADFVEKLTKIGIEKVEEDEVITSSVATALYLSAQYTGPFLAYVVGAEGIRAALQKIGARIVPDSDINGDTNVDCVVVGADRKFTYEKMNTAQRLIRQGALFVATNRDATYPIESGIIPGAGAVVAAVETASGVTPVTIGKPRPVMVQLVLQKYGLETSEVAFVGDRLDTDIACARRAGVAALLVTTGVTTLQEARRAKGEQRPDAVFPNLLTLSELVLKGEVTSATSPEQAETESEPQSAVSANQEPATDGPTPPESVPAVEEAPAETAESTLVAEPEPASEVAAEAAPDAQAAAQPAQEPTEKLEPPADIEWDDSWFADAETEKKPVEAANGAAATSSQQESKEGEQDDFFEWKLD